MSTKRIRRRRKRNETQSRWCIGRDVFDQGRLVHFLSNHLNRCITFLQIVDFYGRGGGGGYRSTEGILGALERLTNSTEKAAH